jgi:glycerol-3-phosphate dehydrogenase
LVSHPRACAVCGAVADGTETPKFKVQLIEDVSGVSLCGALKNVVAVAAGLSDGLGYGNNTKCECERGAAGSELPISFNPARSPPAPTRPPRSR